MALRNIKLGTITITNIDTIKVKNADNESELLDFVNGGVIPTGTLSITNTATYNVSSYAYAKISDTDLVASNIKNNVNILGVAGTYTGSSSSGNLSASAVLSGRYYINEGTRVNGSIQTYSGSTSITPTASTQTLTTKSKYINSNISITGDTNLIASNIKKDTTIFGVTGTFSGGGGGENHTSIDSYKISTNEWQSTAATVTITDADSFSNINEIEIKPSTETYSYNRYSYKHDGDYWNVWTSSYDYLSNITGMATISGQTLTLDEQFNQQSSLPCLASPSISYNGLSHLSEFSVSGTTPAIEITTKGYLVEDKTFPIYGISGTVTYQQAVDSTGTFIMNCEKHLTPEEEDWTDSNICKCTSLDSSISLSPDFFGFMDKLGDWVKDPVSAYERPVRYAYISGNDATNTGMETTLEVNTNYEVFHNETNDSYMCFMHMEPWDPSEVYNWQVTLDGEPIMAEWLTWGESTYGYEVFRIPVTSNINFTVASTDGSYQNLIITCTTAN